MQMLHIKELQGVFFTILIIHPIDIPTLNILGEYKYLVLNTIIYYGTILYQLPTVTHRSPQIE